MDEALNAVLNTHEGAERNQLSDLAGNDLANGVGTSECLPRIFLSCLEGQRDALTIHINVKNFNRDLLANFDNLRRVIDVLPRKLGHVDETVYAAKIHECAKVDDRGDNALTNLPLLEVGEELAACLRLSFFQPRTTGKNNVVAVLVQLDDLGVELTADVRLEIADAAHFDEGCGEEATQTNVQNEATLDNFDDGTADNAIGFLDIFDLGPSTLVLRALLGEQKATFFIFLLKDEGLNLIAYVDDVIRIYIMLDGEFLGGDDALSLVANIQKDFVVVDLDYSSFDDIPVIEVLDGLVNSCDDFIFAADVD